MGAAIPLISIRPQAYRGTNVTLLTCAACPTYLPPELLIIIIFYEEWFYALRIMLSHFPSNSAILLRNFEINFITKMQ
jgi:hypothetical protein